MKLLKISALALSMSFVFASCSDMNMDDLLKKKPHQTDQKGNTGGGNTDGGDDGGHTDGGNDGGNTGGGNDGGNTGGGNTGGGNDY